MAGKTAIKWVEDNKAMLADVNDKIWTYAEVGLQEYKSAKLLADKLEEAGFTLERGVAGMPTAFVATWGSGGPKIGFLAEYDALPHLSQKAVPYKEPVTPDAPGHGCGHNTYGAGVLGAVLGLKEEMVKDNLPGTIVFFGCPAEETLVGKVFMARAGLFNDVDCALTWHPMAFNTAMNGLFTAMNSVKFSFYGRAAHAAGNPEHGRSALDAVELMNTGVNYLREHVVQEARIHYVVTKGGGEPNVVPPEAEVWYYVRAPLRSQVDEIYERVKKIAEGAALMTETECKIRFLVGTYNMLPNMTLSNLLVDSLKTIGPPKWTKEEIEFAKAITESFPEGQKEAIVRSSGAPIEALSKYLDDTITEPYDTGKVSPGSTDVSDVSWITPTAQFTTCCEAIGTPGHSWQFVATSGMSIAHQGLTLAAKVLALSGSRLLREPRLLEEAKKEFAKNTEGRPYKCAVPEDVAPPLDQLPEQIAQE